MTDPKQMIEARIAIPIPAHGAGHVLYSAAFIDPAIHSVRIENNTWLFKMSQPVARGQLETGLTTLIERFSGVPTDEARPVFELPLPDGLSQPAESLRGGPESGEQEIYPGLYVYREPLSTIVRFLDHAILMRFAAPFEAHEESYPNCIPLSQLGKAQHLTSFPEHLHFLTHLREELAVIDGYAERAGAQETSVSPPVSEISRIDLVQNPSTCYHCYSARESSSIADDLAVTALTKCHRYEAANHADFGRLLEFSLREVIFLGDPKYVRDKRAQTLDLMTELAEDWQLHGELIVSNDPFFTNDYDTKSSQQHRLAMKFEYRAHVPGRMKGLAIMSSNLHGPTFSKAFNIKKQGRPINTGCLGFGLERLALALIAQHGARAGDWPDGLRSDFDAWQKNDPLNTRNRAR